MLHISLLIQIDNQENLEKVKFKSNLFGSIGADVFTGPNTIDFGSVFDDFGAKLVENAAVVGTVLGIILIYIPFAILCRRFDKSDNKKVIVAIECCGKYFHSKYLIPHISQLNGLNQLYSFSLMVCYFIEWNTIILPIKLLLTFSSSNFSGINIR